MVTVERRKTSRSLMQLSLRCMGDIAPCRFGLCFMTLVIACFITRSSWFNNSSRSSKRKRTFSYPDVKGDILHPGKNLQTESIIGVIGDDILLDNRSRWIHEVTCEIKTTWLEGRPTPYRVLARGWNNRA
jgi:hypothetical protein